jgi:putative membrane protein
MIFAIGCLGGLIFFSRGLAFLLTHYKNLTYSVIVGMMLGSVYVLWPWQIIVGADIDGHIGQHVVQRIRMFPHSYADRSGTSALMPQICSAMSLGMLIVFLLNKISNER